MLVDKWREYINNVRYKIVSPANAEVETKVVDIVSLLSGKKQDDKQRRKCHVLRLGSRQSDSYAESITCQRIWLSQIPGWRVKQRYFRRSVNDAVLKHKSIMTSYMRIFSLSWTKGNPRHPLKRIRCRNSRLLRSRELHQPPPSHHKAESF